MKVSVVIPNYNGADLIVKNLQSLIDSLAPYKDAEIQIVDDGSENSDFLKTRDFVEDIKKSTKNKITLIRRDKNKGFSTAVNTAALKSESDIIVLLNSDVTPDGNFLMPILQDFKKNKNLFGVGCLERSEEKGGIVLRGRGEASWKRGFLIHRRGNVDKSDTFWVSGGSCALRTDLFKRLGGMDEIYNPFYWEDIDLSYRSRKLGYDLVFEKDSQVIHRHFEGTIKEHYSRYEINKIAYRNEIIFVWKNISSSSLLLSHVVFLPYHMFKSILRGDSAFLMGFFLALLKLPDIIKKRNDQKKYYKKSDKELIFHSP